MVRSHRAHPELARDYSARQLARLSFCYEGMRYLFSVNGSRQPPHSITGNKARFATASALVDFLLDFEDSEARGSWGRMAYRLIYERTCEVVERRLGQEWRRRWQSDYKHLLQLTHWVLPHANSTTFLNLTKTNQSKGLAGRTSWFSTVYREPAYYTAKNVVGWPKGKPRRLGAIVRQAQRSVARAQPAVAAAEPAPAPAPAPQPYRWEIQKLQRAIKRQCLYPLVLRQHSVLGKVQDGTTIFTEWEHGKPPRLVVCDQIRGRTLDELEEIFRGMVGAI